MTANTARTCKVCDNARIILHCMKNDTKNLKVIYRSFSSFTLIFQKFLLKMIDDDDDDDDR